VWNREERRCNCRPGTYWDDDQNSCKKIECGVGWIYDASQGTCIIDVDYEAECPDKMKWSVDKQRCVCTSGYYYSWKDSKCRRVNCGNTRKWSTKQGKCLVPSCDKGQIWRRSRGCHCAAGFYMSRRLNKCTEIPQCRVGDMWSSTGQKCVPDPNYVGDCEANAQWNKLTRKCDCISGFFFAVREDRCLKIDCKDDEKWSKRHTRCIPRSCPKYMVWDDSTVQCECVEDRFWSRRQQRCIPIYCPAGKRFNFKLE